MTALTKRYRRADGSKSEYHDTFDRLLLSSRILNADAVPHIGSFMNDKHNIEAELTTLIGVEGGKYYNNGQTFIAAIQMVQQRLDHLELKFIKMNAEREMHGLPPHEDYPIGMMREKFNLEAHLDVLLSEKALLEERLKAITDKEKDERGKKMLKFGLRQAVQMRGGKIVEIDGQAVTYLADNMCVISEDKSPYWGMSVQDYRRLSNEWLGTVREAEAEKFRKTCLQREKSGLPVPSVMKVASAKAVDRNSLPKFPEWAKRHLSI